MKGINRPIQTFSLRFIAGVFVTPITWHDTQESSLLLERAAQNGLKSLRVRIGGIDSDPLMVAAKRHDLDGQVSGLPLEPAGFTSLPVCRRIAITFGTHINRSCHLTLHLEQRPTVAEEAVELVNFYHGRIQLP